MRESAIQIAVVGAGPAGLALALHASQLLPDARVSLFDARAADADVAGDPRTLALSLGSVQFLRRLGAWPADAVEPILDVHVSQAAPVLWAALQPAEVHLAAAELGVPMLGAVSAYGALVAALQAAWTAAVQAEPTRLHSRFGTAVDAVKPLPSGVEVDAGVAEAFDLAVIAEGGVFADQPRKAVARSYGQTAWVGTATLDGMARGAAFERFTRDGPLALLPLPAAADGQRRAALAWCVPDADDPVRDLDDAQRLAVLGTLVPARAGRVTALGPLKSFALGLNAERTLVRQRTVCIGNAAQTLHPVAGQGLNLGLRDVHGLVAALRFETDLDRALRSVEWARASDRWATIATTDLLARGFRWALPGLADLRSAGLAALQACPPAKRALARQMMFGLR